MKKFTKGLLALLAMVTVVGCSGQKNIKLDFEKVVENVSNVTYVCEEGSECAFETGDPIFGMMMPVDDEIMKSESFNINPENFEEVLFMYPIMNVHSSMYFVGKPAEGKKAAAKAELDAFIISHGEKFSRYLADQYDLVVNRLETTVGDYLVYIISHNNDGVLEAIKASEVVDAE